MVHGPRIARRNSGLLSQVGCDVDGKGQQVRGEHKRRMVLLFVAVVPSQAAAIPLDVDVVPPGGSIFQSWVTK